MKFVAQLKRSHYCGDVRSENKGQIVVLMGWVHTRRDHGGLVFIDLRDRSGLVQLVINPQASDCALAKDLRGEFVVAIQGRVNLRPEG
ncbi:MAG: OB-fold nucleic acid binding domain-containing protein, partial [Bdellovibrionales bacterium]